MYLTKFLTIIVILLHVMAILVHVGANQSDMNRVLATAERWIRYSIHQCERFSYRPNEGTMNESSVPPKAENLLPNSALEQFDRGQDFDYIICLGIKVNFYNWVMKAIDQSRKFIKEDMDKWEKEQNVPGWMRTLRAISDAIGWRHFEWFNKVIYKIRNNYCEIRAELLPAAQRQFCAKADIDYQMLKDSVHGLELSLKNYRKVVYIRLNDVTLSGIEASTHLLHIVLYQTLLNKLSKKDGDEDDQQKGAGTSDQQGGKKIPPYKKDMSSRDYVVYWLSSMVSELKKKYIKARDSFLQKAKPTSKDE